MLSNEPTNNGTVTNGKNEKMSLTHKPLIVMIYIAWTSNAFIGQCLDWWSFIILSILFINNLDLAGCLLPDVYVECDAHTGQNVCIWTGPENVQLIKNPVECGCLFCPLVWSDAVDEYINRSNECAPTYTRWLLYRHTKMMSKQCRSAWIKNTISFAKFNLSTLLQLHKIYLHSNGM